MARPPEKRSDKPNAVARIARGARRVNAALREGFVTNKELVRELATFAPNSGGIAATKARMALKSAQRTFPLFCDFLRSQSMPVVDAHPIDQACSGEESLRAAAELGALFASQGSDKSTAHDYHKLYGAILASRRNDPLTLLEIGLGSHDRNFVSYMGAGATTGGSLRAFRDYLPAAKIYGADVDRSVLFEEERIWTFFVDQTKSAEFGELERQFADCSIDLFIDDGLHSPDANLTTMMFALRKIRLGGWFVVEDIHESALAVWQAVSAMLPARYSAAIWRAKAGCLFTVQNVGERRSASDFSAPGLQA